MSYTLYISLRLKAKIPGITTAFIRSFGCVKGVHHRALSPSSVLAITRAVWVLRLLLYDWLIKPVYNVSELAEPVKPGVCSTNEKQTSYYWLTCVARASCGFLRRALVGDIAIRTSVMIGLVLVLRHSLRNRSQGKLEINTTFIVRN